MILTPEQLKQNAAAMLAFADGKEVEARRIGNAIWNENACPLWAFNDWEYRPKPKPKTRPWSKPEDVPGPVCWLTTTNGNHTLVLYVASQGVGISTTGSNGNTTLLWDGLSARQYSTDRKTWHPCTVTE